MAGMSRVLLVTEPPKISTTSAMIIKAAWRVRKPAMGMAVAVPVSIPSVDQIYGLEGLSAC